MSRISQSIVERWPAPPALVALAVVAALACSPRPAAEAGGSRAAAGGAVDTAAGRGAPSSAESDSGRIARLEREARALARMDGCAASEQCRAAPVGHRACGGPRTYLAYCAATTDSAALFRALDALAAAEEAYQRREGMASTCEFRMPPVVTASAGRCVGGGSGP